MRRASASPGASTGWPVSRSTVGRASSRTSTSTGAVTGARQRPQYSTSAVPRRPSTKRPRLVRVSRTAPTSGSAWSRSSPRSRRRSATGYLRDVPGAEPSSPATLIASTGGRVLVAGACVVALFPGRQVARRHPPCVEHGEPALDALQRLDALALELDEHARGVLVRSSADLLFLRVRRLEQLRGAAFRLLRQAALSDQEGGLLLRSRLDALRLLVDPLRLADLFGDRRAQLIEQLLGLELVDDDVVREGQLRPIGDERVEALDEEHDVDGEILLNRTGWAGGRF